MKPLYQLTEQLDRLSQFVEESGLDEETARDTLEGLTGEIEEKSIDIAKFIGNLAAEEMAVRAACEAMTARAKALKAKQDWLKDYLLTNMLAADITEISCPYFKIRTQKNPESVVVEDEAKIPAKFKVEVPATFRVDKKAIKEAGGCTGASLVRTHRLVIK